MMMMMMGWMMLFKTQGYILYRPTCRVCPSSPSEVSCAPCALCRPSVLHRQGEMHRDQPASALSRKCEERQAASVFSHPLIIIGMFIQVFVEAFSLTRSQSWCRGNGDVIHPSIRLKRSNYRWRQFAWICFCRPCTWFTVKKKTSFIRELNPALSIMLITQVLSAQGVNAVHHLFLSRINSICCVCVVPRFHILPHARFGASCPRSQTNYWGLGGGGGEGRQVKV